MTSILARCESLRGGIRELRKFEVLQDQVQSLSTRRRELQDLRGELEPVVRTLHVLRERGHAPTDLPDTEAARSVLPRLRAKLEEEPAKLTSGRDYDIFWKQARGAVDRAKETAGGLWTEHVRTADPVNDTLLKRLDQLPGPSPSKDRVKTLRQELRSLAQKPPQDAEIYDRFQELAKQLANAWGKLEHRDVPDAVLRFLEAAQHPSGASMTLWITEVRTWLEEQEMLASLRIHYRGRPTHGR